MNISVYKDSKKVMDKDIKISAKNKEHLLMTTFTVATISPGILKLFLGLVATYPALINVSKKENSLYTTSNLLLISNFLNFCIGVFKVESFLYFSKFQWSNKHSPSAYSNITAKNSLISNESIYLIKFLWWIFLYFSTASFNKSIESCSEISASTVLAPAIFIKYFLLSFWTPNDMHPLPVSSITEKTIP